MPRSMRGPKRYPQVSLLNCIKLHAPIAGGGEGLRSTGGGSSEDGPSGRSSEYWCTKRGAEKAILERRESTKRKDASKRPSISIIIKNGPPVDEGSVSAHRGTSTEENTPIHEGAKVWENQIRAKEHPHMVKGERGKSSY